jgi:hypothetical protein
MLQNFNELDGEFGITRRLMQGNVRMAIAFLPMTLCNSSHHL